VVIGCSSGAYDENEEVKVSGAVVVGNAAEAGKNSVSIGQYANSASENIVAVGQGAYAAGKNAVVVGSGAASEAETSVVIGHGACCNGSGNVDYTPDRSVVIGANAQVEDYADQIVIGYGAESVTDWDEDLPARNNIVIGTNANANGRENSIVIGHGSKVGYNSICIAQNETQTGEYQIKIGSGTMRTVQIGFLTITQDAGKLIFQTSGTEGRTFELRAKDLPE
jgi:hypothetical protein